MGFKNQPTASIVYLGVIVNGPKMQKKHFHQEFWDIPGGAILLDKTILLCYNLLCMLREPQRWDRK